MVFDGFGLDFGKGVDFLCFWRVVREGAGEGEFFLWLDFLGFW